MIMVRMAVPLVLMLAGCSPPPEAPVVISDPGLSHVLRDLPPEFLSSPLLHAATEGDVDEVRRLLAGQDGEASELLTRSVLSVVVNSERCVPGVVEALAAASGEGAAGIDGTGSSLLRAAASVGASDCYKTLVALGSDPAQVGANGYGVVSESYLSGKENFFDYVLSTADPKSPVDLAQALRLSVRKNDWTACRKLLNAGADPELPMAPGPSSPTPSDVQWVGGLANCKEPELTH